ncbi:MAG: hypothetical protein JXN65_09505 [Clostridia bacterium]|nr:hypothetical protein [Clostridia bacterium]
MLGILYYLSYVLSGIYVGYVLFSQYRPCEKLSLSLAIGTILSVWLPAIVSIITGRFNIFSNIFALIPLLIIDAAIYIFNKKTKKTTIVGMYKSWNRRESIKMFLAVFPLFFITYLIFQGHVLADVSGDLYGGQSTYGDLPMHMGMITSLANQGIFPPDYSILPGTRLSYPFLVNLQSASMYLMGTSLRWSIIFPSLFLSLSCFIGMYSFAYSFVKKHSSAVLALYLFFITGGLGFIYYLGKDGMMTSIFTGYYMTPTNYPTFNLRWVNVICDMLVPQRTFLIGLSVVIPTLLLIKKALDKNNNIHMLFAGIMASSLPMIHTHSFLALGIICAGLLFAGARIYESTIKDWIKKWGIFLLPVIMFALPQLLYWIFNQADGFLRLHWDWVNNGDMWLWFWVKNIGLPFILIIPAFLYADSKKRLWFGSAFVIFVIAEIIAFQPNEYDNNKLMLIWYVFAAIIVADYITAFYKKIGEIKGKKFIAVIIGFVLFASGTLTIGRELVSNREYRQFSVVQAECAEVVESSTPADALFITGHQHLNEISSLAGRNIYAGSTLYVHFHGLNYSGRYAQTKQIYEDAEAADSILKEIGADYIYISSYERFDFLVDAKLYEMYPIVYNEFDITILAVSDRAIAAGELISKEEG